MSEITATKPTVQSYLNSPTVQKRVKELLDKRSSQFMTSAMSIINAVPLLRECKPETVLSALITAASLDLPINNNLGFAHIIPYKNNKTGQYEAQFQMGYKGFIQLAQRSGQYKTIAATPVYEGQLLSQDPLLGNVYSWPAKKSDQVIGYVAMFQLINGFEKELYMPLDQVEAHGKRYSQSYRKSYGPWQDDFDIMAIKTVLKQLISKFGPMSVDPQMQMAVERDQAVIEDDNIIDYPDHLSEIEERLHAAKDAETLSDILDSVSVEDQKRLAPVVEGILIGMEVEREAQATEEKKGKKTK